jgi:membrane-associated phospholipid phosphatase
MKEKNYPDQNTESISTQLFSNTATTALFTTAIVLLACVLYMVFTYNNVPIDQQVFDIIAPHITKSRTVFMEIISFLGNHNFLIPANLLLLVYFLVKKNNFYALKVAIIALSSVSVMSLLKRSFHRPRPSQPLVDGITNFSFPSGHAFMSIAFYGLLIWLAYKTIERKTLRRLIIFLILLLILSIGFSRIYLRVHYTTDVIAGFCFGTIWLIISLWLAKIIQQRQ